MRRSLKNKFSIILIITIAIFTLLSYFFDQLVIRNEDNLRNSQIKFENLNTTIVNLNSISLQLVSASDHAKQRLTHFQRYRNYWFKNILLITNYDSYPYLTDKEIINTFNEDSVYINKLIKYRFINHCEKLIWEINGHIKKLHNIYGWNIDLFPQYIDKLDGEEKGYYDGPGVNYEELFNKNIDLFNFKEFEIYENILFDDSVYKETIQNFTIKNWSDFHKFVYILTNKLDEISKIPLEDSYLIDDLVLEKEALRYVMLEIIKNISTKKNYFILSSIICQIVSLLLLLVLFRNLIKSKL
tara:strand:- start:156 stop:1052 length:897 start_codon:yes stop_codon:yes gene_type:complete